MKTQSQNQVIYEWLKSGRTIDPIRALDLFGCFRLGARIYDIERKYNIEVKREMIYRGDKKWMKYFI
jgi:hypothetical protein